ncbi:hypothetical protein NAV11_16165 [Pseudomonas songnenensis]|uniref:Secreted protein n=1 Tax=Pseudomonas songnenensis TaxID=1176259 RepID=A0ABX9UQL3_9PSED|nr:hypothetical protein [Pseudomonas songnenensis]MCQ4301448.1 hypothetical protein [Pseudomonas songnenensis]RMH95039.1 hypothetical protein EA798_16980 [Pseudomonas songnenensis]
MRIKLELIILSMALAAPVTASDADMTLQNVLSEALEEAEMRHKLLISTLKERAIQENREDVVLYCADTIWAHHVSNDHPIPKPSMILQACDRLLSQHVYTDE